MQACVIELVLFVFSFLFQTGADGCICYLEYDKDQESLEFIGIKQVKELSLIESVSADFKTADDLANCNYAAGFASTDFIIWNLKTESKVFFPLLLSFDKGGTNVL